MEVDGFVGGYLEEWGCGCWEGGYGRDERIRCAWEEGCDCLEDERLDVRVLVID